MVNKFIVITGKQIGCQVVKKFVDIHKGFKRIASEGQNVKVGDVLVEVDLDMLSKKGYSTDILIILITDEAKADFQEVGVYGSKVSGNENVIFTCYMK